MTIPRDTLIEAVVIGATAGLFAAGVNIAARYTAHPGDVMGFVGGAFGTGAAVLGALWVERRKERAATRVRVAALARMLVGVATRAQAVRGLAPERLRSAVQMLRGSLGTFMAMRATHPHDDPEVQALVDTMIEQAEIARAALAEADAALARGEVPDAVAATLAPELSILIRSVAVVLRNTDAGWPPEARRQAEAIAAPLWEAAV